MATTTEHSDEAARAERGPAPIPTALFSGSPGGPLARYGAFSAAIASRLAQGAQAYGDRSFSRDLGSLLGEIEQEILDIAGWSYILWVRIHTIRAQVDPSHRDPER